VGRTPWHIALITIGLACDLLALAWTIIQLKNHFYSSQSAAISRIALILLIIGCVGKLDPKQKELIFLHL
jgi:H+/gluconate symporter-like permease